MKLISSLLFVILATSAFCHEYYFSFAEMEYNDISRKFEMTITVSTHDMEIAYEKTHNDLLDLENYDANSVTTKYISTYFNDHFELSTENESCIFNLIGFETSLNGTTNFYFESVEIDITPTLKVKNDVLMNEYPKQQNKITLYYQSKSYTFDFLPNERIKTIILD